LDRNTFNHIVKEAAQRKREKYEDFLAKVEILQEVSEYERGKVADSIQEQVFKKGEVIIKEGDEGQSFFMIISGEAQANKKRETPQGPTDKYLEGQYFGELALLKDT